MDYIVSVCHRNSDFHNTDFVIFYGALNVYILVIVILFLKTCWFKHYFYAIIDVIESLVYQN